MGHVDLLAASTSEEHTKHTLNVVRGQLDRISKYIHHLRAINKYKTMDFHGLTMLDMDLEDLSK